MVLLTFRSCNGKGETIKAGDACKRCNGNKTVKMPERLKITIPAGARDGMNLFFRGQAHQEPGLDTGDIIISVHAKSHPVYQVGFISFFYLMDIRFMMLI